MASVAELQAMREALLKRMASGIQQIRSSNGEERFQPTTDLAIALTTLDAEIQKQQVVESGTPTVTSNVSIGSTTR